MSINYFLMQDNKYVWNIHKTSSVTQKTYRCKKTSRIIETKYRKYKTSFFFNLQFALNVMFATFFRKQNITIRKTNLRQRACCSAFGTSRMELDSVLGICLFSFGTSSGVMLFSAMLNYWQPCICAEQSQFLVRTFSHDAFKCYMVP